MTANHYNMLLAGAGGFEPHVAEVSDTR